MPQGGLNLQRNSRILWSSLDFETATVAQANPANTHEIQVLAGFAATPTTSTEDIVPDESGANPQRATNRFKTVKNPADWNLTVLPRAYWNCKCYSW